MPRDRAYATAATLRACAGLVALQAAGLVAVTVFFAVEIVVATADDRARAAVAALLALVAALGLG
ncbi:MAG: hypothetical protein ACRDWY_15415, partial [Actinomycetes bacterium]